MDGVRARLINPQVADYSKESFRGARNEMDGALRIIQGLKFSQITPRTSTASTKLIVNGKSFSLRVLRSGRHTVLAIKVKTVDGPGLNRAWPIMESLGWTRTLNSDEIILTRALLEPTDLALSSQLQLLISEITSDKSLSRK